MPPEAATISRARCSAPRTGHFWRAKSNQKRSPEARGAEAAPSLRPSFAAELCSRGILTRSHKRRRPWAAPPPGLALLSPVLGARYGVREESTGTGLVLDHPFDAGEHWKEQAKPKGIGMDADAFTPGTRDAPCVKLRSE